MKSTSQKQDVVIKQFEAQMAIYTSHGSGSSAKIIPLAVSHLLEKTQTLQSTKRSKQLNSPSQALSVCEFGGGSGATLAEISRQFKQHSKNKLNLINAELVGAFGKHQVSSEIQFKQSSVLDSGFPDDHFDVVCVRHVLHHLIANNVPQTRKNQETAIREMLRIIKPGGVVIIEEQTNQFSLANMLIFWGSKLATILKIDIPRLQISAHTNICYLTHRQIVQLLSKLKKSPWLTNGNTIRAKSINYRRWFQPWWMRYPLLIWNNGVSLFEITKK